MKPRSGSNLTVLLVASAILLVPLASYTTGYFALTKSWGSVPNTNCRCRVYRSAWLAIAFLPASFAESAITGREIRTAWAYQ